jgi:hypothetical protein
VIDGSAAMALVRKYGKPDVLFVCNTQNWDEITQNLYPGQST